MKNLDFIIIGAQKSATTSLFKYLQPHPQIFMPSDKEAPFFSNQQMYEAGWDVFAAEYFAKAEADQLWGVATPQYMGDPQAAGRIKEKMPAAKLIAVLRNPIDRAFSHFNMMRRRERETADFDQVVDRLSDQAVIEQARNAMPQIAAGDYAEDETSHYLVWGEYGRILQHYLNFFPKDQLMIIYMDEMTADPVKVYKDVLNFIGLSDDHIPDNVGKVYHKGGSKRIISHGLRSAISQNALFKLFWDLFPHNAKKSIRYWYDQKNVRKSSAEDGPSDSARATLVDYFKDDIKLLEDIAGRDVPWSDFHSKD